jgi:enamine deaminase RidA (YjgF/YER057c/UK114 family)
MGWSHRVVAPAGRTLYVSGLGPLDSNGDVADKDDLGAQALVTFNKIRRTVEEAGASSSDVVKEHIYVVELSAEKMAIVRDAAQEVFGDSYAPAITAVGVTSLGHPDMLIEVDCTVLLAEE